MSEREPALTEERLGEDAMRAFALWFRDAAERSQVTHPDAACLSTVDADGQPEGRMVLVKGMDDHGISFFTNYESAKGRQLTVTPRAALTLYWHDLGRQVRVRGEVARLSPSESDEYFRTRPRGSQIGAWASEQSRPVEDRAALEARVREVADRFAEREVPRPPHWGGFLLQPREIEFWQAAEDRLHDRILYRRAPGGAWTAQRLFP